MTRGLVFDIEEFAVYDGPGIRSVIFLKGCPLRCRWCHNPEGLSFRPQRVRTLSLCTRCGQCDTACSHPQNCEGCGRCTQLCPQGCLRIAGQYRTPEETAARILPNAPLLQMNGGGVTFSGGEAMAQADFVRETRECLRGLHAAIETSGYASEEDYRATASVMDLVIQDIKLVDPEAHKKWTGADNALILRNIAWLKESGIPFRIRIPLIPGVTDTEENLRAASALLKGSKSIEKVELMRYNRAAGAKYQGLGMVYTPGFDEEIQPAVRQEIFEEVGLPCAIL